MCPQVLLVVMHGVRDPQQQSTFLCLVTHGTGFDVLQQQRNVSCGDSWDRFDVLE